MRKKEKPTIEKLEKLEKKTKDEFAKYLIQYLKENIRSKEEGIFNQLIFDNILNLVKRETNRKNLQKFSSKKYNNLSYKLRIFLRRGKTRNLVLNGDFPLEKLSSKIVDEFDLDPIHLYEFDIGGYRYGPECDEWEKIFDSLDNFSLGAAISAANLGSGDTFKFLYDFGDKIRFKIKIVNITIKNN